MDDAQLNAAPAGQKPAAQPPGPPTRPADGGPPEDWREQTAGELAGLCRAEGLAATGRRAELLKRLERHYHGSSREPVHGRVACPHCGEAALCNGTRWMSRTLLRRSYRCTGRRRHSFHLDSPVVRTGGGRGPGA